MCFSLTALGPDAEGEDGRGDGAGGRHEAHLKFAEASDDDDAAVP